MSLEEEFEVKKAMLTFDLQNLVDTDMVTPYQVEQVLEQYKGEPVELLYKATQDVLSPEDRVKIMNGSFEPSEALDRLFGIMQDIIIKTTLIGLIEGASDGSE